MWLENIKQGILGNTPSETMNSAMDCFGLVAMILLLLAATSWRPVVRKNRDVLSWCNLYSPCQSIFHLCMPHILIDTFTSLPCSPSTVHVTTPFSLWIEELVNEQGRVMLSPRANSYSVWGMDTCIAKATESPAIQTYILIWNRMTMHRPIKTAKSCASSAKGQRILRDQTDYPYCCRYICKR